MKKLLPVSFVLMASSVAASGLQLQATLVPDRALPGVPVSVSVVASNLSPSDLAFPERFVLQVIPENEPPFLAEPTERTFVARIPDVYLAHRVIKPATTQSFFIPLGYSIGAPGAFGDKRLTHPGKYRLQLLFDDQLSDMRISDSGLYDRSGRSGDLATPFHTNEVVLEVEQPTGTEAEVWQRIQSLTGNSGLANVSVRRKMAVAKELWEKFPQNRYTVQLGVSVNFPTAEEKRAEWSRLIAVDPIGLIGDRLRLSLVDLDELTAEENLSRGNVRSAAVIRRRADETLSQLIATPRTPLGKLEAEQKRARLDLQRRASFEH